MPQLKTEGVEPSAPATPGLTPLSYTTPWDAAVGGGVGRLFRIGKQPINASLQAYANVVKPDLFGDVTIRAQIQFLFPK